MSDHLRALTDAGVSIWLDDLSRERVEAGSLAELVEKWSVVGVTSNPTIFAAAIADGERYDAQVAQLVEKGEPVDRVVFELTTEDVRNACDILRPTYDADHANGRVSIEVEPDLASDTQATIASARALWAAVDRPNALVKIPATEAGLAAITAATAEGISVNVTLMFSTQRYRDVMDAYLTGLERAQEAGHDLSRIHSFGSFFVSRVDTEVDKRLEAIGSEAALALRGKAAVANALVAYGAFEEVFGSERWRALEAAGANRQRPLWASTGVKNPDYDDTMYVRDLVVAETVNTMPEKTLHAFADHGEVLGDVVTGRAAAGAAILERLGEVGVDFDDVLVVLETEGVDKFKKSWSELTANVSTQMKKAEGSA